MKANRISLLFLLLVACNAGGAAERAAGTLDRQGDGASRPDEAGDGIEAETVPVATAPGEDDTVLAGATRRPKAAFGLRTDREMLDELRGRLSRSTHGLQREERPDGLQTIRFGERFRHATVVRRMPDGSLRYSCLDSPRAAEALLVARPTTESGTGAAAGESP